MRETSVIVAGHICLDLFPSFPETLARLEEIVRPGRLNYVGPLSMSTGGAVANVGLALLRLGAGVRLMGKVGDDLLGETVIRIVQSRGADASGMVSPGATTSYTVVLAPPRTDRIFLHHPGANDTFTAEDLELSALREARLFHFGYPTLMRRVYLNEGEELVRILQVAKENGVTVSLDMAMPDPTTEAGAQDWPAILRRSLPSVDVFLPSIEECVMVMLPEEYRRWSSLGEEERAPFTVDLARRLGADFLAMGAAVVGIKCGELGYYVRTAGAERLSGAGKCAPQDVHNWAGRELWSPAYQAMDIQSTTGAGDASIAGFLMGLLQGESLETAVSAACAVGWQNLRAMDATSGVGTWQETIQMLPTVRRHRVPLPGCWTEGPLGLWRGPDDA